MNTKNQSPLSYMLLDIPQSAVKELKRLIVPGDWEGGMEVSFGQFKLIQ